MANNQSSRPIDNQQFSFPRTDVPKKDKNPEWHRKFVLAIVNESIGTNYDLDYAAMNESISFFNGDQSGEEFNFIQESADGETLPARWINYNRIRVRIETLLGEHQSRGFTINAASINKDAKVRKFEAKQKSKVDLSLAPARQEIEDEFGLDLAPQRKVMESEEEIDDHYKYTFKEKSELIMERSLRWLTKRNKWIYNRLAAYRDLRIMGKCFYESMIKDGLPYARRIDPRFVIYDTSSNDDFLSDSTYFGKVKYMTLADASSLYGLSKKEIEEVYGKWQDYNKGARTTDVNSLFSGLSSSNLQYFKNEGNDLRVLVLSAYWLDQEVLTHRETVDGNGGEHIKEVSDEATSGNLKRNTIAQWREATLIGGELLKNYGIIENSVRENESLAETSCPIKGLVPHFLNGRTVSVTQQMQGLQKLKDITLYNLQLEMNTAGRKGFMYDVSQTPEGWEPEKVLHYLKTDGVAYFDSKAGGLPSTHNQFNTIDQTLSNSVEQYINISMMIDAEMDAITGVNYARQGQSTGANQGLGVTQTALMQSSMSTRTIDDLFQMLNEQVLNHQAGLIKLSYAGNERYAPILGDEGAEFLEDTVDIENDDFGVYMEEVPPILDDLMSFRGIVETALSSGQISFPDAARLLIEKDISIGIERLERVIAKREKDAMEREEMMLAQQTQANEAAQAQLKQAELEKEGMMQKGRESLANIGGGYKIQDRNLDGRQNIDEIVTEGKIEANQTSLDFAKESKLNKESQNAEIEQLKRNDSARKETKKAASGK
jgi:hypothetical protein